MKLTITLLYNEYVKNKWYDSVCYKAFIRRIRQWYTFWQLCDMKRNDYSTRPLSISNTHIGRKYREEVKQKRWLSIQNVNNKLAIK